MSPTPHPTPSEMVREDNGGAPAHENERIYYAGYAAGIAAERGRIAAWLRSIPGGNEETCMLLADHLAGPAEGAMTAPRIALDADHAPRSTVLPCEPASAERLTLPDEAQRDTAPESDPWWEASRPIALARATMLRTP